MTRQEQEIQEARRMISEHRYTITRPPNNRSNLFRHEVKSLTVEAMTATITTISGETITLSFDIFRVKGPSASISLYQDRGTGEDVRLIELSVERHTPEFEQAVNQLAALLSWPPMPSA